jgi:hypothetical protein
MATIPVNVAPEAAARVVALGMEREFQEMLEHTRETVPGLRAIEVELHYHPENPSDERIVIISVRNLSGPGDDPTNRQWGDWFVRRFPPEVCQHFVMISGE